MKRFNCLCAKGCNVSGYWDLPDPLGFKRKMNMPSTRSKMTIGSRMHGASSVAIGRVQVMEAREDYGSTL